MLNLTKQVIQWIAGTCVVFFPLCVQGVQKDKKKAAKELTVQIVRSFEKLVLDFHDFVLLAYYTPERIDALLEEDHLKLRELLELVKNFDGPAFSDLLVDYTKCGTAYLLSLHDRKKALISEWQNAALELANFLILNQSISKNEAKKLRSLFTLWTDLHIAFINEAAPSALKAAASNEAYTKLREATMQVAKAVER